MITGWKTQRTKPNEEASRQSKWLHRWGQPPPSSPSTVTSEIDAGTASTFVCGGVGDACIVNLVPISHDPSSSPLRRCRPQHRKDRAWPPFYRPCPVVCPWIRLDSGDLGDHAIRFFADIVRAAEVMGWTHLLGVKTNGRVEVDSHGTTFVIL